MSKIEQLGAGVYWREAGILKKFANFVPIGASVLDVGAGSGKLAKLLARGNGNKIELIDVVDHNMTDLPLKIYDGGKLPYSDNSFDVCLLVFVLHHAADGEKLLDEVKRVSKKRIIIVEDTPKNRLEKFAWEKWDYFLNHAQHEDIDVAHEAKSPTAWRQTFAKTGLKIVEEIPFRTPWPVLATYRHTAFVLEKKS